MLRLWRVLNSIGNLVYFIGVIFGLVFLSLILTVFMPVFLSVVFACVVVAGIAVGITGNVQRSREIKRDAVDKELHDIASGRSPDTE